MSKDLLLEIGTEEIPATFMEQSFKQLRELAKDIFSNHRIEIGEVVATGTPRRLVLHIKNMSEKQSDLEKDVRGPATRIAFDNAGDPTAAGAGFARGQGISPEELEIRDTDSGEYVFACTTEIGHETKELLPDLLVGLIQKLNFPKSMRWANEDMRFIRPIKWILSLFDEEVIPFSIAGVNSSNWSLGHRFLSEGRVEINHPSEYFNKLEEEFVIVDHQRREEMVLNQIKELEAEDDIKVIIDNSLLEEVNFLVEYPTALVGSFSEEFLELPVEVLITSMKEHQRYFPVEDAAGNLKNLFVTVRNGTEEYIDTVRAGNEKVLQARLSDAMFFYQEDQKSSLESKLEKLKDIIFLEDLGSLYEKVERMVSLSEEFASKLDLNDLEINQVKTAARLAKADLVTEMVNEFSKLQGTMGKYYAEIEGLDEEVSDAIFEHYLPRYANDILPSSKAGIIVSIADKIDNIVASFSVGIIPTGSQDPYALRRQAQGVMNIIVDTGLNLELDYLIDAALKILIEKDKLQRSSTEVKAEVLDFFKLRLENLLEESNIRYDVSEAILAADYTNVNQTLLRAAALMEFREEDGFAELITAFNRVANLATKSNNQEVNIELLQDSSERELYTAYLEAKEKMSVLLRSLEYKKALQEVAKLKPLIDKFFESVMVMDKDEEVKENRLGLLNLLSDLLSKTADLTKIVID